MARILVIDDEPGVCWAFEEFLKDEGHTSLTCDTAEAGLKVIEDDPPDLVITDVMLPGMSGLELLKTIKAHDDNLAVIVITAFGTMSTAVEAVKQGAYEYITKPVDLDEVRRILKRFFEKTPLSEEVRTLKESAAKPAPHDILIGKTQAMQTVFKTIGALATVSSSVLITGESGSGKELAARAIHNASDRSNGPFVPINCGALPETLLESELFGYEKGAFTGAVSSKAGRFEKADGGTVFLDEIGDLTQNMQVKLLRFLEDRTLSRLGSTGKTIVDVRFVTATHRNLEDRIAEGLFREDLYYRLNIAALHMPPLRDRLDDVPLLVAHFIRESDRPEAEISGEAINILLSYAWPGNVRELKNAIEHAIAICRHDLILPEHLPRRILEESPNFDRGAGLKELVKSALIEKEASSASNMHNAVMEIWEEPLLRLVSERFGGNQVKISEFLGMHRTTLRKKLTKYGIGKE